MRGTRGTRVYNRITACFRVWTVDNLCVDRLTIKNRSFPTRNWEKVASRLALS